MIQSTYMVFDMVRHAIVRLHSIQFNSFRLAGQFRTHNATSMRDNVAPFIIHLLVSQSIPVENTSIRPEIYQLL